MWTLIIFIKIWTLKPVVMDTYLWKVLRTALSSMIRNRSNNMMLCVNTQARNWTCTTKGRLRNGSIFITVSIHRYRQIVANSHGHDKRSWSHTLKMKSIMVLRSSGSSKQIRMSTQITTWNITQDGEDRRYSICMLLLLPTLIKKMLMRVQIGRFDQARTFKYQHWSSIMLNSGTSCMTITP